MGTDIESTVEVDDQVLTVELEGGTVETGPEKWGLSLDLEQDAEGATISLVGKDSSFGDPVTIGAVDSENPGLMTPEMAGKLDGIEENANAYTHPGYSQEFAELVKVGRDSTGHVVFGEVVTKSDITGLGIPAQDTTYANATQQAAGLMSSTDKSKLDGVDSGANAYTHPSYGQEGASLVKVGRDSTGHVVLGDAVAKSDITGLGIPAQDTTYSNATQQESGLMSSTDKAKLDGVDSGANAYTLPTASANDLGGVKVGSGLQIDANGVLSLAVSNGDGVSY